MIRPEPQLNSLFGARRRRTPRAAFRGTVEARVGRRLCGSLSDRHGVVGVRRRHALDAFGGPASRGAWGPARRCDRARGASSPSPSCAVAGSTPSTSGQLAVFSERLFFSRRCPLRLLWIKRAWISPRWRWAANKKAFRAPLFAACSHGTYSCALCSYNGLRSYGRENVPIPFVACSYGLHSYGP